MDPSHRENLITLSTYLKSLPDDYAKFDMAYLIHFSSGSGSFGLTSAMTSPFAAAETINACGTVACALGHAPAAGIKPEENMSWMKYAAIKFGADNGSDLWDWLFNEGWADVDNTPLGGAQRIDYYLEHGIPEEFVALNRDNDAQAFDVGFYR